MKTLIYTSIYSNLWGTEFGGRPGRGLHYKHSLKNILNLSPHKIICFTGNDEVDDLKNWFYDLNNISEDKLEFIVFDLKSTKYFSDISKLKNIDKMKTSDRCFEIQYNKFLWLDIIPELESYDRIYWFDSGLSHGGIFPEKYSFGGGYGKHYNFTLFNPQYVEYLNSITDNKLVIAVKNNSGKYYWSSTIPHKYYNQFNNSEHVIGGFFGGTVSNMLEYRDKFVELLKQLLLNESELYHEELIMSCLYQNNKDYFRTLKFDDWYDRGLPEVYGDNVKYFYNIFEVGYKTKTCVCAISIELGDGNRYLDSAKKLINTHLEYTTYDIILITNKPEYFNDITNLRVNIINYYDKFDESIISDNRFNMHLKRYPIQVSSEMGYENIFYNDCDCYIIGWDDLSFSNKCKENFDVAFVSHANPQLGGLRKTYPHFQEKIDTEFVGLYYDGLDESPNPAETRVIFKNNNKLNNFLHFWGLISKQNNNYFTYHDGVYFGTSSVYAKMNMIGITPNDDFSKYCRIQHSDSILDYFGNKIVENNTHKLHNIDMPIESNNTPYVPGTFDYKGLQMLQHKNVIDVFRHLLSEIKPSTIIEIGTEFGGLTLLLQDLVIELGLNSKIRTYDIKIPKFLVEHPDLTDLTEIRTKDIFTYNPFRLSDEGLNEVKDYMVNDGVNLILCDGGNKSKEFNSFSDVINVGDVIMLHDYIINEDEFESNFKNKIWNWHESKLSDIEESIVNNKLEPYLDDEFSKVVWGCFIKK
jgi:hypothetical protein